MKRFLTALALTCALSGSALAGDANTCGLASPAPDPTQEVVIPGDMPGVDSAMPGDMPTCGLSLAVLTVLDLVF